MYFSFQSLRYFVAVAEEGSVTRAARRLFISQPSVSAAIRHLESLLGQQLFVRLPSRGVILTATGERLLPQARALLAQADAFQATAGSLGTDVSGTLRIACFVNLAPVYFARFLADFRSRYPGITVRFRDGHQEDILEGVRSGLFELAITFDLGSLDEFQTTILAELPPRAVVSRTHALADADRLSLRDLAEDPLVLMDLPLTREYFFSLFRSVGLRPNLQHLTTSFEMVRAVAANGLGYGLINLVPRSPMTYDGNEVRVLPLEPALQPLRIVAIRLAEMPLRPVSEAFLSFASHFFATVDSDADGAQ